MSEAISAIKSLITKMHFIVALAMFFFIALMVINDDLTQRALLLVPVVICYLISKILFAMDQADMTKNMMERYKKSISTSKPEKP
ncbi:hypothetical protein HY988_01280 [Candidatus Micrarchaeota archaeon]|nr:hypothetical protein [Candidatus Micrarchaeota archaeon]